MPIPRPRDGESQDDFMGRCMGNETMHTEFPKQKQRVAVCMQSWRDKSKKSAAKESRISEKVISQILAKYPEILKYLDGEDLNDRQDKTDKLNESAGIEG